MTDEGRTYTGLAQLRVARQGGERFRFVLEAAGRVVSLVIEP